MNLGLTPHLLAPFFIAWLHELVAAMVEIPVVSCLFIMWQTVMEGLRIHQIAPFQSKATSRGTYGVLCNDNK